MKFMILNVILFSFLFISCNNNTKINLITNDSTSINGIYKVLYGEREGFKIWIVDGPKIRREIFGEFLYGGNPERYIFTPEGEIWIDNSITSEEIETTIIHEINERNLMHNLGMSYFDAHDSSLALEVILRNEFISKARKHENSISKVAPIDFDSTQEIENLSDLIKLKDIYRQYIGNRNGIDIWIVDGVNIRRGIYPDFGFSGNDLAYLFIPEKEIWIDAQISCEELLFSIELELKEREELSKGMYYDSAYINALYFVSDLRNKKFNEAKIQPSLKITQPLYRDKGRGIQ